MGVTSCDFRVIKILAFQVPMETSQMTAQFHFALQELVGKRFSGTERSDP